MGYVDADGNLHREGVMRLATTADEILPLKDPRVQKNAAYLVVILLSRVITRLGSVNLVTPQTIEGLFTADLAYLQHLYNEINQVGNDTLPVTCPQCQHVFEAEQSVAGGSWATPSTNSSGR
jgi:hypothetical protein